MKPAPYPGYTQDKWYTKRGKLTKHAARYLTQRTTEHYRWIRDNITEKK